MAEVIDEKNDLNVEEKTATQVDDLEPEEHEDEDEKDNDPNCYLNRGEFSSELFKIELKNLPKSFGFGQLRKYLNSLNLKYVKIKAPGSSSFAFVTFVNEEAKQEAMRILNNSKYKGRQLEAVNAKPFSDPVTSSKRKLAAIDQQQQQSSTSAEENNSISNKNQRLDDKTNHNNNNSSSLTLEERVQNSATPLWKMPYAEQIQLKENNIKQLLRKLLYKIEKVNDDLFFWSQTQREKHKGMCCELAEFVQSPVQENYRNKCEFTIGYDATETIIKAGFRLGEYKTGSNEVVEPYCCKNVPNQMKAFLIDFHDFLNQSDYKPFNVRTHQGHYRQLTLRTSSSSSSNDLLAIIIFDKQDLSDEQISKEKDALKRWFEATANKKSNEYGDYNLKSMLFNLNTNRSGMSKMDNLEVLIGVDV